MEIDADLNLTADRIYRMAGDMIGEGQKPYAIAAVFVMIALQIYKTSLTEQEYDQMIDSISENRDKIKSLTEMIKDPFMKSFH